jgi:hypothetical protein
MVGGIRQDRRDDSLGQVSGALILFLNDLHTGTGFNIRSILSVHNSPSQVIIYCDSDSDKRQPDQRCDRMRLKNRNYYRAASASDRTNHPVASARGSVHGGDAAV